MCQKRVPLEVASRPSEGVGKESLLLALAVLLPTRLLPVQELAGSAGTIRTGRLEHPLYHHSLDRMGTMSGTFSSVIEEGRVWATTVFFQF